MAAKAFEKLIAMQVPSVFLYLFANDGFRFRPLPAGNLVHVSDLVLQVLSKKEIFLFLRHIEYAYWSNLKWSVVVGTYTVVYLCVAATPPRIVPEGNLCVFVLLQQLGKVVGNLKLLERDALGCRSAMNK